MLIYLPLAAFFMDCILGDPKTKLHPVVLLGNLISLLEKIFLRPEQKAQMKILSGGVLVVLVLAISYSITYWGLQVAAAYDDRIGWCMGVIFLSFTISPRSLAEAGTEIYRYLNHEDLTNARKKVGWIVGRDTEKLTSPEIARATVETIAENIVDGIISPLFYYFIGGVPLAVLYRAVNTMDSMLGYKNEKYLYFGRIAARTDDVFNYIPARITAMLLVIVAFFLKLDYKQALLSIWCDAAKHPSPNSGFSEAGVAGALGIRLGGINYYFGIASFRAYMGEKKQDIQPEHIIKTIYMMYGVTLVFLLLAISLYSFFDGGSSNV